MAEGTTPTRGRRRRSARRAGLALLWLALAAVGVVFALPQLLAFKITRDIQAATGRKASVSAVRIRRLSELTLVDLSIYDQDAASGVFLYTPRLVLTFDLHNIFSSENVVVHVAAHGGSINVRRLPDGSWNVPIVKPPQPEEQPKRSPDIDIYGGSISIDGLGPEGKAPTVVVSVSHCSARQESADGPVIWLATGRISGAQVTVSATVGTRRQGSPVTLHAEGLPADVLLAAAPVELPLEEAAGTVTVNASRSDTVPLRWDASFEISRLKIRGALPALSHVSGYVRSDGKRGAFIERASGRLPGAEVKISGGVGGETGVDLSIRAQVRLGPFLDALREGSAADRLPPAEVSGTADVDAAVKGPPGQESQWTFSGTAKLHDVACKLPPYPPVSRLRGTVTFDQQRVASSDLQGEIVGYPFRVSGELSDFKDPYVKADCTATLNLEALAGAGCGGHLGCVGGAVSFDGRLAGRLRERTTWSGSGRLSSKQVDVMGLQIYSPRASFSINGGKVQFSQAEALICGGRVTGAGEFDTTGPAYFRMQADVSGAELGDLLRGLGVREDKTVAGRLDCHAEVSGAWGDLSSLKGGVELSVVDGDLKRLAILRGIGGVLGVKALETAKVDRARGSFSIRGGVFETRDLTFNCSPDIATFLAPGWVDYTGELSFAVATVLPESLARRTPWILQWPLAVLRAAGRVVVPTVLVTGTVDNPKYVPLPVVGGVQGLFEDVLHGLGLDTEGSGG